MNTFSLVKHKDETKHGPSTAKNQPLLHIYHARADAMNNETPHKILLNPPPADPACCHPAGL